MEYTVGEGPCVSAYRTKVPVFDADLADEGSARWPEFRRGALAAGVQATFGFPLLIERICIGALNLYHDRPGALSEDQAADALVVAAYASRSVLAWQADAPPGTVAWQLANISNNRVEIHQATGRISVQVGVSLDDALALLRAYAFSHDRGNCRGSGRGRRGPPPARLTRDALELTVRAFLVTRPPPIWRGQVPPVMTRIGVGFEHTELEVARGAHVQERPGPWDHRAGSNVPQLLAGDRARGRCPLASRRDNGPTHRTDGGVCVDRGVTATARQGSAVAVERQRVAVAIVPGEFPRSPSRVLHVALSEHR